MGNKALDVIYFSCENFQIKRPEENTKWPLNSTKQRISSCFKWVRVIREYVTFLNEFCRILDWMKLKAQRILKNETHCHLFNSDWKKIVLPGVTISFKHLKWRKVSVALSVA